MKLQETGLDTVEANRALGLPDDCREYTSVSNILQDLNVKSIRLMVSSASVQHLLAKSKANFCAPFVVVSHTDTW